MNAWVPKTLQWLKIVIKAKYSLQYVDKLEAKNSEMAKQSWGKVNIQESSALSFKEGNSNEPNHQQCILIISALKKQDKMPR